VALTTVTEIYTIVLTSRLFKYLHFSNGRKPQLQLRNIFSYSFTVFSVRPTIKITVITNF